jgi:hypothetical protein
MNVMLPIRSGCKAAAGAPEDRAAKGIGFTVVRLLLGISLLAAAGLKVADDGAETAYGFGPFASGHGRLAQVEVEAFLGSWLLVGLAADVLRVVAMLFFAGLTAASLFLVMDGQESCGCFGARLSVPPWYTAAGDALAVAALLFWRPGDNGAARRAHWLLRRSWSLPALVPGAAIGGMVLTAGWAAEGRWPGDGRPSFRHPENWTGKRLPLLPYIDIGGELEHGRWLVVFYRQGCPKCDKAIAEYRERARAAARDPRMARVAFVEVTPHGNAAPEMIALPESPWRHGAVPAAMTDPIATPAVVFLDEGRVRSAGAHPNPGELEAEP